MKRNACLTLTLVELLCGVGLVFTIGAQTASSEKHAFMPVTRPRLRNQRLLLLRSTVDTALEIYH
jgi:hypothetical protein